MSETMLTSRKGPCALHPSSVNWKASTHELSSRHVVYLEMVRTSKVYIRDCTPVSWGALLLFGGHLRVLKDKDVIAVDEWTAFRAPADVAHILRTIRHEMDEILRRKILEPQEDIMSQRNSDGIIKAVCAILEAAD